MNRYLERLSDQLTAIERRLVAAANDASSAERQTERVRDERDLRQIRQLISDARYEVEQCGSEVTAVARALHRAAVEHYPAGAES